MEQPIITKNPLEGKGKSFQISFGKSNKCWFEEMVCGGEGATLEVAKVLRVEDERRFLLPNLGFKNLPSPYGSQLPYSLFKLSLPALTIERIPWVINCVNN